ncbi:MULTISPECIES: CaiB/BaiF CoA transferase family protein [Paraburkholderia]|uniref:CaiB/BaiF CoA transferase family protein n=1 Tax=Paraburkholderia TaxID=1822464 RepID=UPI00224CB6CD|nr:MULTISPECIES: CoA transferase [Paraburkholderia]MCX4177754.1 CoA transferase [Paraburkholderia madseniana]MDQ6465741.1 CoA transferase [Paraburkholderia madseniana]
MTDSAVHHSGCDGVKGGGALQGLKVLDLSRVLAGPYAGQILADHGADVIKVEPPQGDETRELGPPFVDESAAYFHGLNRNKRAISLDLSLSRGREVLLDMLASADVLIENFLSGTMRKWGIGYEETLAERFPQLIYCRISGYGEQGPLSDLPGYDAVLQAFCGLMSVNGHANTGPTRVGVPIVDAATGLSSVIGILLALAERNRSGRGQLVATSLFDTALGLLHPHPSNWFASGNAPKLTGNAHPNISPYDTYHACNGVVFIGVVNDAQFRRFCGMLGRHDLIDDPRFATNRARVENRDTLREEIEHMLCDFDATVLCERLTGVGVSASKVNSVEDVLQHPHTRARGMVVELPGYRGIGPTVQLSRTPARVRTVPPTFAADLDTVMAEVGYRPEEVEIFIQAGATPRQKRTKG